MEYILIVLIVIGFIYLSYLQTPKAKGLRLEKKILNILKTLAIKLGGIEFHDHMYEDSLSTSQIDNMLLTSKALYVIEAKNYHGHIFGSESQDQWTMTVKHVNKKRSRSGKVYHKTHISKHSFYNPLKQNQTHINKIKNLTEIHNTIPIYNIVVFGSNAYLRDVKHSADVYVINLSQLKHIIVQLENSTQKVLTLDTMQSYVEDLYYFNDTNKKNRKSHVKRLQNKYK